MPQEQATSQDLLDFLNGSEAKTDSTGHEIADSADLSFALEDLVPVEQEKASLIENIAKSFPGGFAQGIETYVRAGRMIGVYDDRQVEAAKRMVDKYKTNPSGYIERSLTTGIESTINSILGGLPGMLGGLVGGLPGAVVGYAGSAGMLFSLAEYDQFMEQVDGVLKAEGLSEQEIQIARQEFTDDATISALAEGGFEAASDLIQGKLLGFFGEAAISATAKQTIKNFAAKLLKAYPVEAGSEVLTSIVQRQQRSDAGINSDTPISQEILDVLGSTAVQTFLFTSGATARDVKQTRVMVDRAQKLLADASPVIDQIVDGKVKHALSRKDERNAVWGWKLLEKAKSSSASIFKDKIDQYIDFVLPKLEQAIDSKTKEIQESVSNPQDKQQELIDELADLITRRHFLSAVKINDASATAFQDVVKSISDKAQSLELLPDDIEEKRRLDDFIEIDSFIPDGIYGFEDDPAREAADEVLAPVSDKDLVGEVAQLSESDLVGDITGVEEGLQQDIQSEFEANLITADELEQEILAEQAATASKTELRSEIDAEIGIPKPSKPIKKEIDKSVPTISKVSKPSKETAQPGANLTDRQKREVSDRKTGLHNLSPDQLEYGLETGDISRAELVRLSERIETDITRRNELLKNSKELEAKAKSVGMPLKEYRQLLLDNNEKSFVNLLNPIYKLLDKTEEPVQPRKITFKELSEELSGEGNKPVEGKRVVSKEQKDAAVKRLIDKGKKLTVGVDPSQLKEVAIIGAYYFESGVRNTVELIDKLSKEFGTWVKDNAYKVIEAIEKELAKTGKSLNSEVTDREIPDQEVIDPELGADVDLVNLEPDLSQYEDTPLGDVSWDESTGDPTYVNNTEDKWQHQIEKNQRVDNAQKLAVAIENETGQPVSPESITQDTWAWKDGLSLKDFIKKYNKYATKRDLIKIYRFNENFIRKTNRVGFFWQSHKDAPPTIYSIASDSELRKYDNSPSEWDHTSVLDSLAKQNGWKIVYSTGSYFLRSKRGKIVGISKTSDYKVNRKVKDNLIIRMREMWKLGQYVLVFRSASGKSEIWVKTLYPVEIKVPKVDVIGKISMTQSNVEKILKDQKSSTLRTYNLQTGNYRMPDGTIVHLTNQGLKSIEDIKNPDELAVAEGYFNAEQMASQTKFPHVAKFFKGEQKLYVYDIKPVYVPSHEYYSEDAQNSIKKTRKDVLAKAGITIDGPNVLKRSQILMATGPVSRVSERLGRKTRAVVVKESMFAYFDTVDKIGKTAVERDGKFYDLKTNKEIPSDKVKHGHDGAIYVTREWLDNYLDDLGLAKKSAAKSFIWQQTKDGVIAGKGMFFVAKPGSVEERMMKEKKVDMLIYEDASKLDYPHDKVTEIDDTSIRFKLEEGNLHNKETFSRSQIQMVPMKLQSIYNRILGPHFKDFRALNKNLRDPRFARMWLGRIFGLTRSQELDNFEKLLSSTPQYHPAFLGVSNSDTPFKNTYLNWIKEKVMKMPRPGFHTSFRPSESEGIGWGKVMVPKAVATSHNLKKGDKLMIIRHPLVRADSVMIVEIAGFHGEGNTVMMNNLQYAVYSTGDFDGDSGSVIIPDKREVMFFEAQEGLVGDIDIDVYKNKNKPKESVYDDQQLADLIVRNSAGKDLIGSVATLSNIYHVLAHNQVGIAIMQDGNRYFRLVDGKPGNDILTRLRDGEGYLIYPKNAHSNTSYLDSHRIISEYHLAATDQAKEDVLFDMAKQRHPTLMNEDPVRNTPPGPIKAMMADLFEVEGTTKEIAFNSVYEEKTFKALGSLFGIFGRDQNNDESWKYDTMKNAIAEYNKIVKESDFLLGNSAIEKMILNIYDSMFPFNFAESVNSPYNKAMIAAHKNALREMFKGKYNPKTLGLDPREGTRIRDKLLEIWNKYESVPLAIAKTREAYESAKLTKEQRMFLSYKFLETKDDYQSIANIKLNMIEKEVLEDYFKAYNKFYQQNIESFKDKPLPDNKEEIADNARYEVCYGL